MNMKDKPTILTVLDIEKWYTQLTGDILPPKDLMTCMYLESMGVICGVGV